MSDNTNEMVPCANCGELHYPDKLSLVHLDNGETAYWCDDCVSMYAEQCDRCGELYEHGELARVIDSYGDDVYWCMDCVSNHAYVCDNCGAYTEYTTTVYVNGGTSPREWCQCCVDEYAFTCERCEDLVDSDSITEYHMEDGTYMYLCDSCHDDHYCECEDCGRTVHVDDVWYSETEDANYCERCYAHHSDDDRNDDDDESSSHHSHHSHHNHYNSSALQSYSHTGGTYFWLDNGDNVLAWHMDAESYKKLYLGIELETEHSDDACHLASDLVAEFGNERICCKRDGSLDYGGVEIVSQPMTPICHLSSSAIPHSDPNGCYQFGLWGRVAEIVHCHNGRSHDGGNCGLHIHISRDYFTCIDATYRIDRLFNRFRSQMVLFSRRQENNMHYCKLSEYDELHNIKDVCERKSKWREKKWGDRYVAVNDNNAHTIEIRLWRGSLNVETLRATIEFTAAVAIVANAIPDEMLETLTWNKFKSLCKFALAQNNIPTDDLTAYLVRRGL